ncbi:hypothetical protein HMN09_00356200 [Mycena chlorophos]|uniref:Uncharacterized protein n=1 Tax=Mycena chlorophos TaxID=658473 RepID=A0A8H6TGJ4_MYCCL|nr:hypothetical protein HMN09_00356200 [Mycena chlorophos]
MAFPRVRRPRPHEEGRGAGGVHRGHRGVPDGRLRAGEVSGVAGAAEGPGVAGAGQTDEQEASQDWDEVARPVDKGVGPAGAKCPRNAKRNVSAKPEDVYGQTDSSRLRQWASVRPTFHSATNCPPNNPSSIAPTSQ